jgi:hypothetical protein
MALDMNPSADADVCAGSNVRRCQSTVAVVVLPPRVGVGSVKRPSSCLSYVDSWLSVFDI